MISDEQCSGSLAWLWTTSRQLMPLQPQDLPIKTISTRGMIRYIVLNYRIHHGFTRFGQ